MISAVMPADHFFNCSGHAQFEIMSTLHRFSFLGHGRLVRQGVHVHIFWFQILYFATSSTRSKELVMNPCRYAQYFSQKFSRALSRFENCRSKNDLANFELLTSSKNNSNSPNLLFFHYIPSSGEIFKLNCIFRFVW